MTFPLGEAHPRWLLIVHIGNQTFVVLPKCCGPRQGRNGGWPSCKDIGKIINVSVSDGDYYPVPRTVSYEMDMMKGMGGGEMAEATQVEAGETKISVSVTLSYEIK